MNYSHPYKLTHNSQRVQIVLTLNSKFLKEIDEERKGQSIENFLADLFLEKYPIRIFGKEVTPEVLREQNRKKGLKQAEEKKKVSYNKGGSIFPKRKYPVFSKAGKRETAIKEIKKLLEGIELD